MVHVIVQQFSIFRRFPKINKDSRRLPKNSKYYRGCPKTVEDVHVQRQPKISEEKSGKFFKSRQELTLPKDYGFLFFTKTLQTLDSIFSRNSNY